MWSQAGDLCPPDALLLHRYACPTKGEGCVMRPPHRTEFEKYHRVPDGVKLVTAAGCDWVRWVGDGRVWRAAAAIRWLVSSTTPG
ncbi:hypothetical protein I7I50_05907 [Histoplasma capsulatum G186AR]|uniref:Uncharacterized protein n=1 Tax=Ajellomyces capsulatus TaxID=5037 RepID=A0A8H7ZBX6_AJECA|nr:hypothetical protein I7I52_04166 [Histoplasma capsulatum]QSS76449.1 hypothetical protein I7I50_05907 [Histoplasma capsulatum G186AR]